MLVVDERDQEVLESRIFVPPTAGFAERVMEGLFELASGTRHFRRSLPAPWNGANMVNNVIRAEAAIKARIEAFQQIIARKNVRWLNGRASHGFLNSSSAAERCDWTRSMCASTRAISAFRAA